MGASQRHSVSGLFNSFTRTNSWCKVAVSLLQCMPGNLTRRGFHAAEKSEKIPYCTDGVNVQNTTLLYWPFSQNYCGISTSHRADGVCSCVCFETGSRAVPRPAIAQPPMVTAELFRTSLRCIMTTPPHPLTQSLQLPPRSAPYPSQSQEIRGLVAVEINAKSTSSQTNRNAANWMIDGPGDGGCFFGSDLARHELPVTIGVPPVAKHASFSCCFCCAS
jgi:hypothetical protein